MGVRLLGLEGDGIDGVRVSNKCCHEAVLEGCAMIVSCVGIGGDLALIRVF